MLAGNPAAGFAQTPGPSPEPSHFAQLPAEPIAFEHNSGQAPSAYRYLLHSFGVTAGFTNEGLVLALSDPSSLAAAGGDAARPLDERVLHFRWIDANRAAAPEAEAPQPSRLRYLDAFTGQNGGYALREIAKSGRIRYRALYEGIDLIYYPSGGELEFDLELAPYANPRAPLLEIAGADRLELDGSGALIIHAGAYRLRQRAPVSYQYAHGQRMDVPSRFELLADNRVRMNIGPYGRSLSLTVDPILEVATIFGAKEATLPSATATDSEGNIYLDGISYSPRLPGESTPPVNPTGAFGRYYISKISADLSRVLMTIRLDLPAITPLASSPKLYIAPDGTMYLVYGLGKYELAANAKPTTGPFGGPGYQNWPLFQKIAVTAIDPSGATLRYRTVLGCMGDLSNPLAHASADGLILAGSVTCRDFPVSPGAFTKAQTGSSGLPYGFVARITANGSAMPYSTVIGGNGETVITSLDVDSNGRIWLGGWTSSSDFPAGAGAYDSVLDGRTDAFVMRLSADGGTLEASTLYGARGEDTLAGMRLASNGEVVVATGRAPSDFPASANAFMRSGDGNTRVFTRFSEDLKTIRWATHYPHGYALEDWALNEAGEPLILTFPDSAAALPITPEALLHKEGAATSLHIGRLRADGAAVTFGSMYFSSAVERPVGVASWKGSVLTLVHPQVSAPFSPPISVAPLTVDQSGPPYGVYLSRLNLADLTICTPRITPESQTVSGAATSASLHVEAAPGCPWIAASPTAPLPATAPIGGIGSRDLTFAMLKNPSSVEQKVHEVFVDGIAAKVIQNPISCDVQESSPAVFHFGPEGGTATGAFSLGMECERRYQPGGLWLSVVDPSGQPLKPLTVGPVGFTLSVGPNSFQARSTTFQLGKISILVSQLAGNCTATVTPSSAEIPASGGTVSISLATSASTCAWDAITSSGLAIEGSSSGAGSAAVLVKVPPNPTNQARTEAVSVAGKTVEIHQAAGQCAATVSPRTVYVPQSGSTFEFDIRAEGPACAWNPAASALWISQNWEGSPHQGSGKLQGSVSENRTGTTRVASITVLGQTVEVVQYAEQSFSLTILPFYDDLPYSVNGEGGRGMRTYTFPVGTPITLVAPETFPAGDGMLRVIDGWGDTGTNTYSFTATSGGSTLMLRSTLYFRVRVAASGNTPGDGSRVEIAMVGGVRRDEPDGIYISSSSTVRFEAIDGAHSIFSGWGGSLGNSVMSRVTFSSIFAPGEMIAFFTPGSLMPYPFDPARVVLRYGGAGGLVVLTGRFDISNRGAGSQTLRPATYSCDSPITPPIRAYSNTGVIPGSLEIEVLRPRAAVLPNGTYDCHVMIGVGQDAASVIDLPVRIVIEKPAVNENGVDVRAVVDAAAYRPFTVPAGGIATIFGMRLANDTLHAPSLPLPLNLGGARVVLADVASGTVTVAPLFYVSPTQINFYVPSSHPAGESEVRVSGGGAFDARFPVNVQPAIPNFFSANANGKGVATGQAVLTTPGSPARVETDLANCPPSGGACTARRVNPGAVGQDLFLVLYGTGFPPQHERPTVYIDGQPVTVDYNGPQGQYVGLDQVNLRIPPELRTPGVRTIEMEYMGYRSNAVTVLF